MLGDLLGPPHVDAELGGGLPGAGLAAADAGDERLAQAEVTSHVRGFRDTASSACGHATTATVNRLRARRRGASTASRRLRRRDRVAIPPAPTPLQDLFGPSASGGVPDLPISRVPRARVHG